MLTDASVRNARRYSFRLAIVPLLALIAYPNLSLNLDAGGVAGAVEAAALLAGWSLLWVALAGPRRGDPDVHDRQVDVILAVPLLAAAVWLDLGFARRAVTTGLSNHGVISLALFLTGASLLLLGTRLTARLRWALAVPLLAMPLFTGRPVLLLGILATGLLLALVGLARRGRNRAVAASWSGEWSGGWLRSRLQPLPRVRTSLAVVGVLGVVLAVTALITPAPAPGAMDAAQPPVSRTTGAPGTTRP